MNIFKNEILGILDNPFIIKKSFIFSCLFNNNKIYIAGDCSLIVEYNI